MQVDLGTFDPKTAGSLKIQSEAQGLLLKSFGDLFRHPSPPVDLLKLVKDFAKANLDHPASGMPGEIATALYYASIAVALVNLNQRISQLPDADLRRGSLKRVKEQPWLDEQTKELFSAALTKLSSGPEGAGP